MPRDSHQKGDSYEIRSIYFDDYDNNCMMQIEDGVDNRKKYRIRSYDGSAKFIRLEIKEKINGYNRKQSCVISLDEFKSLVDSNSSIPFGSRKQLNELLLRMKADGMRPKAMIAYERCAYTYPVGNVRITFDRNIAATRYYKDFFEQSPTAMTAVLPKGMSILEVKYDELLPDIIAAPLELGKLRQTSFSKYYIGRRAIMGDIYNV